MKIAPRALDRALSLLKNTRTFVHSAREQARRTLQIVAEVRRISQFNVASLPEIQGVRIEPYQPTNRSDAASQTTNKSTTTATSSTPVLPPSNIPPSAPVSVATLTMARIYRQQGKFEQAREIYAQLLKQQSADTTLQHEMKDLEQLMSNTAPQAPADGTANKSITKPDEINLTREGQNLNLRWAISREGKNRASLVLGGEGTLAVRLVGFAEPGALSFDTPVQEDEGNIALEAPEGASRVAAAIGLLAEQGRFVSIVHCDSISLGV